MVQTNGKSLMCYGCEVWTITYKNSEAIRGNGDVVSEEDAESAVDGKNIK
jgi:hypothetical protein